MPGATTRKPRENTLLPGLLKHLLKDLSRGHGIAKGGVAPVDLNMVALRYGAQAAVSICRVLRGGSFPPKRPIEDHCIQNQILDRETIEPDHFLVQESHVEPRMVAYQDGTTDVPDKPR